MIDNYILTVTKGSKTKFWDIINNVFDFCFKRKWIKENPCTFMDRPKNVKQTEVRCYEFEEQSQMIERMPKTFSDLFYFLCCTGLRISECMALTEKDIKPNYILINKNKDTKTGKIIHSTKNGDIRKVMYCNDIVKYLDLNYIQSVSYSTVSRMLQKYYKDFEGVNLHSTRHTYASVAHHVGIDDKIIQRP